MKKQSDGSALQFRMDFLEARDGRACLSSQRKVFHDAGGELTLDFIRQIFRHCRTPTEMPGEHSFPDRFVQCRPLGSDPDAPSGKLIPDVGHDTPVRTDHESDKLGFRQARACRDAVPFRRALGRCGSFPSHEFCYSTASSGSASDSASVSATSRSEASTSPLAIRASITSCCASSRVTSYFSRIPTSFCLFPFTTV